MSRKIALKLLRIAADPEGSELLTSILFSKTAMDFPTEEAMKKYLDAHPKADKSIHHVVETDRKPLSTKDSEPPKKELTASDILHKQVGSAQGSNEGGFFIGKDGKKRYAKFYRNSSQSYAEHISNEIYRALDLGAPESHVFEHKGKTAFASDFMTGLTTFGDMHISKEQAKDAMKGFVADVLTCNWDAAGTGLDNFNYSSDKGTVRIDQGGTFMFRAQGAWKPESFWYDIKEWDGLLNPNVNRYYSRVARIAGYETAEDMKELTTPVIDKIEKISKSPGGWKKFVEDRAEGMDPQDRNLIVKMLDAKSKLLIQKRDKDKGSSKTASRSKAKVAMIQSLIHQILSRR